ncbi:MAG: DUF3810 family protein [Planctomycetota bacterium]
MAVGQAARAFPEAVEQHYARSLYPKIGAALNRAARGWESFVGLTPGDLSVRGTSLSEALVGLGVGALAVLLWRAGRRGVGALFRRVLVAAGLLYGAFLLTWGLNHARLPLASTLGLEPGGVTAQALNEVALELERDLRAELLEYEDAGAAEASGWGALAARAWAEALVDEPELGWQAEAVVRAPAASSILAAAGISGIFSPFTQEAHVAAGMPAVDLAFTACHEIAHAQGWAREDEANYLAWRVASRSSHAGLRRAGLALALVHVHRALRRADPKLQHARALALDVRIVTLLEERSAYWAGVRSQVAAGAAGAVNDAYLRSQGQRHGVASYGRMVDLLVAELR